MFQIFSFSDEKFFCFASLVSIYQNGSKLVSFKISHLKQRKLMLMNSFLIQAMGMHYVITCACCCFFAGLDRDILACQNFYKDGLTLSFTKILTDDAVNGWKYDIQVSRCLVVCLFNLKLAIKQPQLHTCSCENHQRCMKNLINRKFLLKKGIV